MTFALKKSVTNRIQKMMDIQKTLLGFICFLPLLQLSSVTASATASAALSPKTIHQQDPTYYYKRGVCINIQSNN